jgi:hypothetical protein
MTRYISKLLALLVAACPGALLAAAEGGDKLAPEPTVAAGWVYFFFLVFVGICVWIGIAIWRAEKQTRSAQQQNKDK